VPNETQSYVQTYFLNQFIYSQPSNDIIDQNLNEVGISILNYFDIGYVIVHYYADQQLNDYLISRNCGNGKNLCIQEHMTKKWIPQTKATLFEIFSKPPDYEDEELFAYKVPKPTSDTPFLVLYEGWNPFIENYRTFNEFGIIKIINPQINPVNLEINIDLFSLQENDLELYFNDEKILVETVYKNSTMSTGNLKLNSGESLLKLKHINDHEANFVEKIRITRISPNF